jgi:hypothetical protein
MNHPKMAVCLLLFVLSGCDRTATLYSQPSVQSPAENHALPSQSTVPVVIDGTEEMGDPLPPETDQTPTPEMDQELIQLQSHGLLPEFVGDLDTQGDLTFYEIEVVVELDPSRAQASIEGIEKIIYTNRSGTFLKELVLMLWPNGQQYNAEMVAGPVQMDGEQVDSIVDLDGLALRVFLPEEISPGEKLEVRVPFSIEVGGSIRDQRKRFGMTHGILMAPTFYPLIPRLVGGEWQAEIPPEGGDTTNSDVAFYHVTITAPEAYEIVSSGIEVDRQFPGNDQKKVSYVTGPMRDFAMAVGPLVEIKRSVNNVRLNVWTRPDHVSSGERLANAAAMQMAFIHDLVGPYPYVELDILDTPCAFGGIEYPGLIYICSVDDGYFIDTAVHEVAHQWFYGLIGNDQIHEPWLDESIATYWQVLYYENAVGEERAANQLSQYRSWASGPENQNAPIGLGIDEYRLDGDYYTIVYFKGAVFYDALREQLGDEAFFQFLQTYYDRYRYQFVHSLDLQETAEDVCACDLSSFFDLWVYQGGEIPGW